MATSARRWTFLTNHGHALVCIARDPDVRIRDIADRVGITERAAQSIVADLVAAGYVTRERVGRRNRYELQPNRPLRHVLEEEASVGDLLAVLIGARAVTPAATSPAPADPVPAVPAG